MPTHLAVPFRLDPRGQAATLKQDSPAEVAQSVRILLDTRPGERLMVPDYGVDDLTFVDAIDDGWVADAVQTWEPRATVDIVVGQISARTDVTVEVR